ncbi:actin beta/gamma 1 [Angomonas deanei]|nr:actin beta/gamma 1 [Angomonas deanei]|eukprot:EPY42379.1 actin beta/gamma 1 [Angomonas deanei]
MSAPSGTVLMDCGAHHVRAGYAGEKGPRLDIPAIVGHPRHRGIAMAAGMNEFEIGEEALVKQGMLSVGSPIHNGEVTNWDDMEKLWTQLIFSELRVIPENHCFITCQTVNAPAPQKEKTLELFMETFNAHSVFWGTSQVLSLYSYGLTTGLVLDSGKERTMAVPVHEGYALGRHVVQSEIAGEALTDYLYRQLRTEGYSLGTAAEKVLLNAAKEDLCYVRCSPFARRNRQQHMAASHAGNTYSAASGNAFFGDEGDNHDSYFNPQPLPEESFSLPDGQQVPLRDHRWKTSELLFDFSLYDPENPTAHEPNAKVYTEMGDLYTPPFNKGVSWLPFASIHKCEVGLRPLLFSNIVIAGNTLGLLGARERVQEEVTELYRSNLMSSEQLVNVNIRDMACRGYSAWLGGSMLSRTSMFPHLVVTKKEYEEEGLRVAHCKFL